MYKSYEEFNSAKERCRQCPIGLVYDRVICSIGNTINPTYMICGEAPGKDEVRVGQPFVGKAGEVLRKEMIRAQLNKNNCVITNTIPCRPKDNQFPHNLKIVGECMDRWLLEEILLLKPKYILLVGSVPTKYVLGCGTPISKVRGQVFDCLSSTKPPLGDEFADKYNIRIKAIPTFHPSYIARNGGDKTEFGRALLSQFRSDIEKFKNLPNTELSMNPTF